MKRMVLWGTSPYSNDAVGRRVCLSEVSYAAAEKSEWRMALKI
jgi:hypothetical protein